MIMYQYANVKMEASPTPPVEGLSRHRPPPVNDSLFLTPGFIPGFNITAFYSFIGIFFHLLLFTSKGVDIKDSFDICPIKAG